MVHRTLSNSKLSWLRQKWQHFRLQSLLNICVNLAEVVCGLAVVWATKLCVDLATNVPHGTWTLFSAGALLVGLMLTEIAIAYSTRWIRALLGVRSKNAMQEQLYSRLLRADWQALHRQHSGQLMNRLQDDSNAISAFLSEQFPVLISTLVQFVGAFCFLYWMERPLALLIAVLSPLLIIGARLYMHRMSGYRHDQRNQEARVHSYLQETLQQSLVIKTFEKEQVATDELTGSHDSLRSIIIRNTRFSSSASLMINVAFVGGYLLAFFWGVTRLHQGLITFGAMIAFIQLVGQIQGPIRRLTNYASVFVNVFTAAERLMEVEAMPQAEELPLPAGDEVALKNISFSYEGIDKAIFKNWTGTFPAGSVTAVVGHTGAGKTTLISILLGLLRPQEGEVHTHPSWFSYVPQGNTLFSGTIRRNLLWGNPDATDEQMLEVLQVADAEFVLHSEAGLDLACGERGGGLSEGQAQRIGIARALLRPAPILLLDESFSALDSDTALRIMQNIRTWIDTKPYFHTIICITHRESLIPMADHVLRIED